LAGLSITNKVSDMDENDYDLVMDVNLKGSVLCAKHFIHCVDKDRGGLIINIGSMASKRANPNAPLYCTAKAAVNMFSKALAMQVKENNIRVTTLNPGATDTEFWGDRKVASEKFMKVSNIADVIKFVISMDSKIVMHEIDFESFDIFF